MRSRIRDNANAAPGCVRPYAPGKPGLGGGSGLRRGCWEDVSHAAEARLLGGMSVTPLTHDPAGSAICGRGASFDSRKGFCFAGRNDG